MKKHYDVFVRAFAAAMLAFMSAGPSESGAGGKIPPLPEIDIFVNPISIRGRECTLGSFAKFLSLHYYTTLEDALSVQRSGEAQGTIICSFGLLLFSPNRMAFQKPTKIIKIQLVFFMIFSEFVQFWLENSRLDQLDELKLTILLLLTPKPSLEVE